MDLNFSLSIKNSSLCCSCMHEYNSMRGGQFSLDITNPSLLFLTVNISQLKNIALWVHVLVSTYLLFVLFCLPLLPPSILKSYHQTTLNTWNMQGASQKPRRKLLHFQIKLGDGMNAERKYEGQIQPWIIEAWCSIVHGVMQSTLIYRMDLDIGLAESLYRY